jgi:soluble lytic murein transglycosylase-like protein
MSTIQQQIIDSANSYGVDPNLALAVAQQESGFRQNAVGTSGEIGVFQLMPRTAQNLGVNPYDVNSNIDGGVGLLAYLLKKYNGDTATALAAYNAGETKVDAGLIPDSTQAYVGSVMGIASGGPNSGSLASDVTGLIDAGATLPWVIGIAAVAVAWMMGE